jgi:RecB family exonuclease
MIAPGGKPPVEKWSFSAILNYEQCAYRIFLKSVEKVKEPERDENHPARRGERIHTDAELFIKGEGPLTKELEKVEDVITRYAEIYSSGRIELEQKWGYDREWGRRAWNEPECWGMIKCDLVEHSESGRALDIGDWKSGKRYGNEVKHQQQMQLYGIGGFMRYPNVDIIRTTLWYVDEGKKMEKTYDRTMLTQLLPRWEARAKQLTGAMVFKPRPSKTACNYCPFGAANGNGACAYAVVP